MNEALNTKLEQMENRECTSPQKIIEGGGDIYCKGHCHRRCRRHSQHLSRSLMCTRVRAHVRVRAFVRVCVVGNDFLLSRKKHIFNCKN